MIARSWRNSQTNESQTFSAMLENDRSLSVLFNH